jgi:pyridoxal phosphate enzyme (YggS family)
MTIAAHIKEMTNLIHQAEMINHRPLDSVKLLAVTKQQPIEAILQAFDAGVFDFGENYLQEALLKINTLSQRPIRWHFIGSIQSRKAKAIAQHFSWVHTLSDRKIADSLNKTRSLELPPLNVCIQLNLDDEESKSGIRPEEAAELAAHVLTLPRLTLRGLMVIPKQETDTKKQCESFLRVTHLLNALNKQLNCSMDTLSMGMSNDFNAAIQAGSTLIRIGTAIFGKRP